MSSKDNLVRKTDKKDFDEIEETEYEEIETKTVKKSSNNDAKKSMIKFMGIIIGITILLLLILFIASLGKSGSYSYTKIETIMKEAAVSYFKDHPDSLPQTNGGVVEIDSSNLVAEGKMKDLSEYTKKGVSCTGSVLVEKSLSGYLYTPQLDCGEAYTTIEFSGKILDKEEIVTSGYGLYEASDGSYVFRGEKVNNYVKLDASLWRIVKITNEGNVVLISDSGLGMSQPWDNRYNAQQNYGSGINEYGASRVKEYLDRVYENPVKDDLEYILSAKDKNKIVNFPLCIGKRDAAAQSKDNSIECSSVIEDQRWGLLTLSEYMMASIDPNCNSSLSKSCQNYNYLALKDEWWLATADSKDDSNVYMIKRNGSPILASAANYAIVRPVIYLNGRVRFMSGNGTFEKPYTLR